MRDESARDGDEGDDSDRFSDESEQKPEFEEVQYAHADGSASRALLLSENHSDGRPPMCLKLVATGKLKRVSLGRVLRNEAPPLRGGGAATPRRAGASVRTQSSSVDSGSASGKRAGGGLASCTHARARTTDDKRLDVRSAGVADWATARGGNTERALTAAAGPSPCDPYRHALAMRPPRKARPFVS